MRINQYELERLSEGNLDIALRLTERFVGKGLYSREYLQKIIGDKESFFFLLTDKSNGGERALGYFFCFTCLSEDVEKKTEIYIDTWRALPKGMKIGVCKSIGIDEGIRRSGVSDKLLQYFTDILLSEGVKKIFVPSWVKGDYIPAKKLLERCGYTYLCKVSRPWYTNRLLECPFCKSSHCVCDAVIYFKNGDGVL